MKAYRVKWSVLAVFWVLQALAQYLLALVWFAAASGVNGPEGRLFGRLATAKDFLDLATDPYFAVATAITATVITLAQAALLWPVARPAAKRSRGWPVWVSLAVAGIAIATLGTAAVLAADSIAFAIGTRSDESEDWVTNWRYLVGAVVVAWVPATALLVVFARGPGSGLSREDLLARTASLIFKGTMVEVAAIIPLDVMVRRRTTCYCDSGTFAALTLCGTVGLFALGPAIFLPLIARRRKPWHQGRCEVCGYDMAGNPKADRCPECGAGWRPAA